VRNFPGADPTKVKAMVETGNVEWDLVIGYCRQRLGMPIVHELRVP
jgi:hypothetical protein